MSLLQSFFSTKQSQIQQKESTNNSSKMEKHFFHKVLIVGAGPSGLAVAACLSKLSIPSLILEKDDCIVPLWQKKCYDRLGLILSKRLSTLPHFPHSKTTPKYMPKSDFISYMDNYVKKFKLQIKFRRKVQAAHYESESGYWVVEAQNKNDENENVLEVYRGKYLVVAAGENYEGFKPDINGLSSFEGKIIHSSEYKNGLEFKDQKKVLVVGSGSSGLEIALDLCEAGAQTSIVMRRPTHILWKEAWDLCITLSKYLPLSILDHIALFLCYIKFGNTAKYGIKRPKEGPFLMKSIMPVYHVIDVGTYNKIKSGEIRVLSAVVSIEGNMVNFSNGNTHYFDAIILATGYRSTIRQWFKNGYELIGDDGMAKNKYPNHWKGSNGLYCAGLVRRGLYGSSEDGLLIANDISKECNST